MNLFHSKTLIALFFTLILLIIVPASIYAQDGADERYFAETGYQINNDTIWDYFQARGGINTFGYPVSNTFLFRGFPVQIFQRHVIQAIGAQARPINLLDPTVMPLTTLNLSKFPSYEHNLAAAAPTPNTPNYSKAVLRHMVANVLNEFEGQPVGFLDYYYHAAPDSAPGLDTLIALEVWGFPTSGPMRDPNNRNFIYQRFQRGIMHYDASRQSTGGILIGDAFKSLLTGFNLPDDLANEEADSPFFRLYNPGRPNSLNYTATTLSPPINLTNTDLSNAFNPEVIPSDYPVEATVNIYLVALDDNGQSGPLIGCQDSIIAVERPIAPIQAPLRTAIEELLSLQVQTYGEADLYNALYQSTLTVHDITIENRHAMIYLSGAYLINGVCDDPRVEAQLEYTAKQFAEIDSADVYINGQLIGDSGIGVDSEN